MANWYDKGNLYGIDPLICLNHGVNYGRGSGSTRYANFPIPRTVLDDCLTTVLAFIHVSFMGLLAPMPRAGRFAVPAARNKKQNGVP